MKAVILAGGLGTRISDAKEVSVASIARSILEALAAKPDWDLDPTQ
jgi:dTDP-glucose pyrophosphorylase